MLDEWAGDLADVERNQPGLDLRPEVETRLVPGLLTVDALLLEADVGALTRLPEWLELVQTTLPADAESLGDGWKAGPRGIRSFVRELGVVAWGELECSGIQGAPGEMALCVPRRSAP